MHHIEALLKSFLKTHLQCSSGAWFQISTISFTGKNLESINGDRGCRAACQVRPLFFVLQRNAETVQSSHMKTALPWHNRLDVAEQGKCPKARRKHQTDLQTRSIISKGWPATRLLFTTTEGWWAEHWFLYLVTVVHFWRVSHIHCLSIYFNKCHIKIPTWIYKVSIHFGFSTYNIQPNDYANKIRIHQMTFSLLAYLFVWH